MPPQKRFYSSLPLSMSGIGVIVYVQVRQSVKSSSLSSAAVRSFFHALSKKSSQDHIDHQLILESFCTKNSVLSHASHGNRISKSILTLKGRVKPISFPQSVISSDSHVLSCIDIVL